MNLKLNIYQADNGAVIMQPDHNTCEVVKFGKKDMYKTIKDHIGKEIFSELEEDMNTSHGTPIYGYKLEVKITRIEKDPYK